MGLAETVDYDPISSHVSLAGRDLAALMLDAQIQQPFSNMT